MTFGEKIFFFILAFRFLVATAVPLEFSLVPKINCFDLNRNACLGHDGSTAGLGRDQRAKLADGSIANNNAVTAISQLDWNNNHVAILRRLAGLHTRFV